MSPTVYRWLADLVVVIHAAFIAFVVGGQLLILLGGVLRWAWVRSLYFRVAHLAAIALVVVQAWLKVWCPLTILEEYLRNQAGETRYGDDVPGFIGYWAHELIFYDAPSSVFTLIYSLFGLLVLATIVFVPPRRRTRPAPPPSLAPVPHGK